jgi:hypothetical protein
LAIEGEREDDFTASLTALNELGRSDRTGDHPRSLLPTSCWQICHRCCGTVSQGLACFGCLAPADWERQFGYPSKIGEVEFISVAPAVRSGPAVSFGGSTFCFTGTFAFGSRKDCENAVIGLGGIPESLTQKDQVPRHWRPRDRELGVFVVRPEDREGRRHAFGWRSYLYHWRKPLG